MYKKIKRLSALPALLLLITSYPFVCSGNEIKVSANIFNNLTFEQKNNWIGVSFLYDVIQSLQKIKGVQVIYNERLNGLYGNRQYDFQDLSNDKDAVKAVKAQGAQYLVVGNFQILDGDIIAYYRLLDVYSGDTVFTGFVKGYPEQLAAVEENVGKKIIESFKTSFSGLIIVPGLLAKPGSRAVHENYAKGLTCSLKSESKNAIDCFQKVIDESVDFAPAYLGQGSAYLEEGNILMALERLNKALPIYQENRDHFFVYLTYYKIAEAYFLQGTLANAEDYYKKALNIKIEMKHDMHLPLIYSRLSEIALKNGDMKKAVSCAEKAIKENTATGDKASQVNYLVNLARLYMDSGSLDKAGKTYDIAINTVKQINYPEKYMLDKFYLDLQSKRQAYLLQQHKTIK
jgi:tetratricopeptide (TPR) repeat protein